MTLPTAFFRHVKTIADQQEAQTVTATPLSSSRFSGTSYRSSASSAAVPSPQLSPPQRKSTSKLMTSAALTSELVASAKTLEKLTMMLTVSELEATKSKAKSTRSVSAQVAAEHLLQLWECMLQLLGSCEDDAAPAAARELKLTAVSLLQAIVQRQEFDVILNALASGACHAHRSHGSDSRKRRVSSVRLERRNSFQVVPTTTTTVPSTKKSSTRRSFLKKSKRHRSSSLSPSLCLLVRKYLELHQTTLQFAEDSLVIGKKSKALPAAAGMPQMHELLSTLVAASYIRIPFLREKIIEKMQQKENPQLGKNPPSRSEDLPHHTLAIFKWQHTILSKCSAEVAPLNRDEFWYPNVRFLESVLANNDACMMVCGNLIQHVTAGSAWGRIEWTCIPGFSVLVDQVMAMTKTLFQSQANALEQPRAEDFDELEERASTKHNRKSFSIAAQDNSPGAFFLRQSLKLLRDNQHLIHSMMMAIFKSTNYMLPHHVDICLQYMERFIAEFPAYFRNEPSMHASHLDRQEPHVDIELMRHVFTCLLESEHFEILKASELFLLKHFASFSMSLRSALVQVFEAQFRHLFLHWSRDVRYCYYHILLYLTYPGNRIVLCARSDESILGAESSQLFEIPGLVRTSTMANWDAFDAPLHEMLKRYNRATKQRKSGNAKTASNHMSASWVDSIPFTVLARSVPEYRGHVQTYFQCAKQISLHEPVPTPAFHVKSAPHS